VRTAEPLIEAVHSEATFAVISYLVKDLGADVNQRRGDERGCTALTLAAFRGHLETVRYLVEELGADVDISDSESLTPLYIAAASGHLAVVRVLLELGADINQGTDDGATPLMAATEQKHEEIVTWLVKAGADTQIIFNNDPNFTAASLSKQVGASAEQTAYLEAKIHCSNAGCSGAAGALKCTGCKQVRYCGEVCQLAHWRAHKTDCKRWSAEL
jgi:ankyrin repeat protein